MVAGGFVLALALLVAVVAVGAGVAALLAAPALEARGAVAGPGDGVAQGPVLALAAAAAVGSPVVAVARWTGEKFQRSFCGYTMGGAASRPCSSKKEVMKWK